MEVHTLTSEHAVRELRKYIIKPSIKKKLIFASILLLLVGVAALFVQFYSMTVICFIGIAIFFLELYFLSKKQVQMTVKRLRELYNTDKVEGKLIFEDDKLRMVNFATNGELRFSYHIMSRFVETEHYYALFTKEYQALIVDKEQFTPETNTRFLQLMHEKMPALFKPGKSS